MGPFGNLRPMVILTKCVISILSSAIVLAFGIYDKIDIKNHFLGEIHKFRPSSISLCLVGEMA